MCPGPVWQLRAISSISAASPGRLPHRYCSPKEINALLLERRGARRLSSQSLLDIRISRQLSFGGAGRIELLVDLLNVLNDPSEEGLVTDNLFSPNFGRPTIFVDPRPRRVMLGARLNLGR